ncbi:NYN domain-containing protein [Salinifilum aidingensis]
MGVEGSSARGSSSAGGPEDGGPEGGAADEAPAPDESASAEGRAAGADVDWSAAPTPIRRRLAELAAAALDAMRPADVPVPLRPVMRFAPAKRARLGEEALLAGLRDSAVFRAAVVEWCRRNRPEAVSLEDPDPVVAAAAGLLRDSPAADRCVELVSFRTEQGRLRHELDTERRRCERLETEAHELRAELDRARQEAEQAKNDGGEAQRMRKRLREQGVRLKEAKDDAARARQELEQLRQEQQDEQERLHAEVERARSREQEQRRRAEHAAAETEVARQSAREARQGDEMRLALLLDTLDGVTAGLRRELAPGGTGPRPAELVERTHRTAGGSMALSEGPMLDRILRLPEVHLVVDGYNVTKTGYPELPLADQRERLTHQLAALAARTGAEVTAVFDGADVLAVPTAAPRGVRVLFSDPGVQADDVIREVVAAEPWGRQVVVATSDREIVDSVVAHRSYVVSSTALLEHIGRI